MPRIPRGQQGGYAYHVINRGNGRGTVFHKTQDYEAFLSLLVEAKKRHQVKMSGFCLMPNHFHLVLEPPHQTALSQFTQWLLTSHVRRYHKHYGSSGHIWQGRFKSFPIQRNEHLITVLRYVLQNPVRAGLSSTPREWLWSSLRKPQLADPCAVSNRSNRVTLSIDLFPLCSCPHDINQYSRQPPCPGLENGKYHRLTPMTTNRRAQAYFLRTPSEEVGSV